MRKIIVLLLAFTFACEEDPEVVTTADVATDVRTKLSNGRWRVDSFMSDGLDATSSFQNFIFEFESTGVFTGEDLNYTHFGTWAARRNSASENSINNVDVDIAFPSAGDFQKFNRAWKVTDLQDATLTFVSGNNEVRFIKN